MAFAIPEYTLRVETARFGPFTFQVGVDAARVETLLLLRLHDSPLAQVAAQLERLVRAPLVHYYYEVIHPFWDGNGRVGRVLEATLLLREGFRYAPFAQARYYLDHIHRYYALFNACHKAAEAGRTHPKRVLAKRRTAGYSCRSAWIGSRLAARRAGK